MLSRFMLDWFQEYDCFAVASEQFVHVSFCACQFTCEPHLHFDNQVWLALHKSNGYIS